MSSIPTTGSRAYPHAPCVLALTAFVVLIARSASAQIGSIPEPPPGSLGQLRFGSVVLTPSVGFTNIGIDRNVFNKEGVDRKSDFTFTLGPQAELFYGNPRIRARATVGVAYVYYAQYESERGVNPGVRFEGLFQVGRRLTLFTDDRFSFTKDRPNAEVDARTRRAGSDVLAGVRVGVGPRIGVQFDVHEVRTNYGNAVYLRVPLEETLDRVSRTYTVSTDYRLTPYTTVFTGVSFGQERFPNTTERNGTSRGVFAGLRFAQRARVSGEATVGYSVFDASSVATNDHHGMTFNLRLYSTLTDSLLLSFDGRQDLQFSYSQTYPYYVDQRYRVSLTQRLGRILDVSGTTQQDWLHYARPASSPSAAGDPGTDRRQDYTVGPGFNARGIRVGAYVGYSTRRSAAGVNQPYEGFRYGVQITTPRLTVNDQGVFVNGPGR